MDTAEDNVDTRPWRKRHPVLSRTILYTLGLGLAALLVFLLAERKDDDHATEILALQKQLDGLGLILAADPSGDEVLRILNEHFDRDDLPTQTQGRALRWRAMAWRRKAFQARAANDATLQTKALAELDAAHAAAAALDLEPAERYALRLERAEALLEQRDTARGIEALPALEDAPGPVPALMRHLLHAQALRLQGNTDEAVDLLRSALRDTPGPLTNTPTAHIGGRDWSGIQIAVQLANFVTSEGHNPADSEIWLRLRAQAPTDFETHAEAALGLLRLGHPEEALRAWTKARSLDERLAQGVLRRNKELAPLEERLRRP